MAEVAVAWENIQFLRQSLELQRTRVKTAREQVEGRTELYRAGEGSLDQKVRAEQALVDALRAELAAEIELQQAIVAWTYETGQQEFVTFTN